MPEPYNLSKLNEIAKDEFEQMACNPLDSLDIGIKPYSLEPGKKYILNFKAMRPNGVYGELRYTMLINTPPENGMYFIEELCIMAFTLHHRIFQAFHHPQKPVYNVLGYLYSYSTFKF